MRVALVGPEIEENLALRYLYASLRAAGHQPRLFDFHRADQLAGVARVVAEWSPDVVGLSMVFTARCREFLALAARLRVEGCDAHVTGGGHFAMFNADEILRDHPAFDSIVHGEGEDAIVDLANHLDDLGSVIGLSWRSPQGVVHNGRRPNTKQLDDRPWPARPDVFHTYLGRPIANILAGRGCWFNCNFCSITAWHEHNGGPKFRLRDVRCVAREMAALYHERGVRIFNFQDDNFFLPTEAGSIARIRALGEALRDEGVGHVALQAKARPDSISHAVVAEFVRIGLFRLFLGVESDVVDGLRALGRGIDREQNHRALAVLREQGIHTCFNLLMFDPWCDVASIRTNVAFMSQQRFFPLNFCRVEVYSGTPLERQLREAGRLIGDYTAYAYDIADPAAQRVFVAFEQVFHGRNFANGGSHHASMNLDYHFHLLRHFLPTRADAILEKRVKDVIEALNQDSARRMAQICDAAEQGTIGADVVAAMTADREAADVSFRTEIYGAIRDINTRAAEAPRSRVWSRPALAMALLTVAACKTPSPSEPEATVVETTAIPAEPAPVVPPEPVVPPPPVVPTEPEPVITRGPGIPELGDPEPPTPPKPRPAALSAAGQGVVIAAMARDYGVQIGNLLATAGVAPSAVEIVVVIGRDGRATDLTVNGPPGVEPLANYLGLIQAELSFALSETGPTSFTADRVATYVSVPIEMLDNTHMCEMAPPPNYPDYPIDRVK